VLQGSSSWQKVKRASVCLSKMCRPHSIHESPIVHLTALLPPCQRPIDNHRLVRAGRLTMPYEALVNCTTIQACINERPHARDVCTVGELQGTTQSIHTYSTPATPSRRVLADQPLADDRSDRVDVCMQMQMQMRMRMQIQNHHYYLRRFSHAIMPCATVCCASLDQDPSRLHERLEEQDCSGGTRVKRQTTRTTAAVNRGDGTETRV